MSISFNSKGLLNLIEEENKKLIKYFNSDMAILINAGKENPEEDVLSQTCEYFNLTPKDIIFIMRNEVSFFINKFENAFEEAHNMKGVHIEYNTQSRKPVYLDGIFKPVLNNNSALRGLNFSAYFIFVMYILKLKQKDLFNKIKRGDEELLRKLIYDLRKARINTKILDSTLEWMTNKGEKLNSSNKDSYLAFTDLL